MNVQVALLTAAIDKPLTYAVPQELARQMRMGCAVIAPLQSRFVSGVVVGMDPEGGADGLKPLHGDLKSLHSLLDEQPALNPAQLALARWVSEEYYAPLGRACALMVPPGFTPRTSYVYAIAEQQKPSPKRQIGVAAQIIQLLQARGPHTEAKLKKIFRGVEGWQEALKKLVDAGEVSRTSTLKLPKTHPVRSTLAQLTISSDTLEVVYENLWGSITKRNEQAVNRRVAALQFLQAHNGLAWADWLSAETSATRPDLYWLAEQNYLILGDAERWRDPLADTDYIARTAPPLTTDQQRAWDAVRGALEQTEDGRWETETNEGLSSVHRPPSSPNFLLRGVTGSGKTEIYMRAAEMVLQREQGAIILVPEISLTPQTSRRFLERFPGKVALVHSRLSPGERFDTWRRIRDGHLPIVVGARSALFAPVPRIGLIVLDEEHDSSYKQSAMPYYDARRVAEHYAAQTGATLIFGSATPSLEAIAQVAQTEDEGRKTTVSSLPSAINLPALRLLELPNRVRGHVNRIADQAARMGLQPAALPETEAVAYQPLPDVQVIDMRAELRGGNMSMFSGALHQSLAETLARGEQALLFLNRRGTASCVLCRDCGDVLRCPNDDTPLTLHTVPEDRRPKTGESVSRPPASALKCHQCDHTEPVPAVCPSCGRNRIRFIGLGTQKIEQALHESFPKARVVRWDKDNASARSGADQMLKRFVDGNADVLVGTQMIAKGLDLPRVTLVGVVLADVGLFLPDFRASERVFQLIEQVAGRAGRGLLKGRVIVQTYNPETPAIRFAARHDVLGFDRYEMAQRKPLRLPPFTRLVRFECADENADKARQTCEHIARQLRRALGTREDPSGKSMVIGPAQAYFARRNKQHRWQVIARATSPRDLLARLEIPRGVIVDVDPASVL